MFLDLLGCTKNLRLIFYTTDPTLGHALVFANGEEIEIYARTRRKGMALPDG